MSSSIKETTTQSFEPIESKKTYEVNPEDVQVDTRKPEELEYKLLPDNESFYDFEEEDFLNSEVALQCKKENLDESSHIFNKDFEINTNSTMYQSASQKDLKILNSLNMTFRKAGRLNQWETFKVADQIEGEPEKIKFVKISFQECTLMKDIDLENIGKAVGSKLGSVEYLNLSLYRSYKTTIFGINQLISGISGQRNTIKVLRLRIRRDTLLGNQSVKELIRILRMSLVNLEELKVVLSGNLWVTSSGVNAIRDDAREIEGLGLGLKKYEIVHYFWHVVSLVKDGASKDLSKYVMEKFEEMGVKEGMLVNNKVLFWHEYVVPRKVVNSKIIMGENTKPVKAA